MHDCIVKKHENLICKILGSVPLILFSIRVTHPIYQINERTASVSSHFNGFFRTYLGLPR